MFGFQGDFKQILFWTSHLLSFLGCFVGITTYAFIYRGTRRIQCFFFWIFLCQLVGIAIEIVNELIRTAFASDSTWGAWYSPLGCQLWQGALMLSFAARVVWDFMLALYFMFAYRDMERTEGPPSLFVSSMIPYHLMTWPFAIIMQLEPLLSSVDTSTQAGTCEFDHVILWVDVLERSLAAPMLLSALIIIIVVTHKVNRIMNDLKHMVPQKIQDEERQFRIYSLLFAVLMLVINAQQFTIPFFDSGHWADNHNLLFFLRNFGLILGDTSLAVVWISSMGVHRKFSRQEGPVTETETSALLAKKDALP